MKNSVLRQKFNFCFFGRFLLVLTKFHFGRRTEPYYIILWMQLVYTSLIVIIPLHFSCGERKICPTIKQSKDIMNTIVGQPPWITNKPPHRRSHWEVFWKNVLLEKEREIDRERNNVEPNKSTMKLIVIISYLFLEV